jgi:hypothetical protein
MLSTLTESSMRKTSIILVAVILAWLASATASKKKDSRPTVRWSEDTPGCTFSTGDDGVYHWGLWTSDLGVTLSVDSQELVKSEKRIGKPLLLKLTVKYRGPTSIDVSTNNMSLEFVRHSHVVQTSIDPDGFTAQLQANVDALEDETQHQIKKHPDKKDDKEPAVQDYLRISTEFQDFLTKNALRDVKLDSGNTETTGWVGFSTRNKWIGAWKKQEQFILRMPFEDRIVEFPFSLPPTEGDLILRKRP